MSWGLDAIIKELREEVKALKEYVVHKPDCDKMTGKYRLNGECYCTCGLSKLMKEGKCL